MQTTKYILYMLMHMLIHATTYICTLLNKRAQ